MWRELPAARHRRGPRARARRRPADRARRRHPHRRPGRAAVGAGDPLGPDPRHDRHPLLPELVGRDVAKELTFTGRRVSGAEAVRLGLATRAADDPLAAATELAREIAGNSPDAVRGAKRLLNRAADADLAGQFLEESRTLGALSGSPNQVEAVRAYFDKRPPVFTDPA